MTPEAVVLILGGCTTFVGAGVAGWKALREGASARQRNLMDDLEEARDREAHNARQEAIQRRYWETRAQILASLLSRAQQDVPPADPPRWVEFEAKK